VSTFVVVQAPPINTSWKPSYLSAYEGCGGGNRSWCRDVVSAHVFDERADAELVASGVRTTYDVGRGWRIDVCEVQP
jgi:hypothetical protein